MANLVKKCECAEAKAKRTLDLRKADDRKTAERLWGKCDHSWVVRYRLGGRGTPQKEQSFPHAMKRDAEKLILDIKGDKVSHLRRVVDPKAGAVLFAGYADKWLTGRMSLAANSTERYASYLRNHINPALGHLRINGIKRQQIKALITSMKAKGYAASTVHGCFAVINSICEEAMKDKLISETPCVDIELPSTTQKKNFLVPSWGQIKKLSDAMPKNYAATVWLMAGCGLRIGEAIAVTEDCLMFGGRRLRIHEQVTQKHGLAPLKHRKEDDYRDVPLPRFVREIITAHIETHGTTPDGYLFQGRRTVHVHHEVFRKAFKAAARAAGLPEDFTPHSLRHAFASMQLAQRIPITDVSAWLGHNDINTTYQIYGHLVEEAWDRALEVMETAYQEGVSASGDREAC